MKKADHQTTATRPRVDLMWRPGRGRSAFEADLPAGPARDAADEKGERR